MLPLKILIFIIATAIIAFVSRKSLLNIHSHVFFRFFAFESIIILFLLNVDNWFVSPLSPNQKISWIMLFGSIIFVVEGFRLLRVKGLPDDLRHGEDLFKMEKTTRLVTEGIYSYIRHPLYSSLLLLAWGIFFKSVSTLGFFLVISTSLFLTLTAKIEEKENCKYFGNEYESYIRRTKMFIPFIW